MIRITLSVHFRVNESLQMSLNITICSHSLVVALNKVSPLRQTLVFLMLIMAMAPHKSKNVKSKICLKPLVHLMVIHLVWKITLNSSNHASHLKPQSPVMVNAPLNQLLSAQVLVRSLGFLEKVDSNNLKLMKLCAPKILMSFVYSPILKRLMTNLWYQVDTLSVLPQMSVMSVKSESTNLILSISMNLVNVSL